MKKLIQLTLLSLSLVMATTAFADVQTTRQMDKSSPKATQVQPERAQATTAQPTRAQATPAKPARATPKARDFERKLAQHHRSGKPIPGEPAGQIKAKDPEPPKYEIADCGEGLVCCSYSGANSTCNLFMYLCTSQGGQATGDQNEAVCKF